MRRKVLIFLENVTHLSHLSSSFSYHKLLLNSARNILALWCGTGSSLVESVRFSVCFFSIVIWNIETKQAICGSSASAHSAGHCLTVQYSNTNDNIFVSAGRGANVKRVLLMNRKFTLHRRCFNE